VCLNPGCNAVYQNQSGVSECGGGCLRCQSRPLSLTLSPTTIDITNMNTADRVQIVHDIRRTTRELKERGLLVAAKWSVDQTADADFRSSELLAALPKEIRQAPNIPFSPPPPPAASTFSPSRARPSIGDFLPSPDRESFGFPDTTPDQPEAGPSRSRTRHGIEYEEETDPVEEDEFQLARTYFDLREFDRVAWVLKDAMGSRSRFLRVYSAYLVS
jgi:anaphase-promoting complex subunit 8